MKKITTSVTSAKNNGGLHDPRNYKKAVKMLTEHDYKRARLYHLCFTGSTQVATYLSAIKALAEHLRDNNIRCQYKASLEDDGDDEGAKELHMHIFILTESILNNPDHIINRKSDGWLAIMILKNSLDFHLNPPRSPLHYGEDGSQKNYATLPKSKPKKLADCINWISYLYKVRSKPDLRQLYYSSKPAREKLQPGL
jgi:hypothetical protein